MTVRMKVKIVTGVFLFVFWFFPVVQWHMYWDFLDQTRDYYIFAPSVSTYVGMLFLELSVNQALIGQTVLFLLSWLILFYWLMFFIQDKKKS